MNEFNIALDVDKLTRAQPPVVIAQGDRNGTTIRATVYDHGTLLTQSGLSARFKMRLPDGRYFYSKAATWTASTGTVSVTIDETQAASAVGTTTGAYFELLSGTTVVYSTSRFTVRVLRSATDMSAQADSYDDRVEEIIAAMDVAVEAVEDAQEAAASANSAAASANTAASNANTARDNANSAASAANSAASTATSAAGTANAAAGNANSAAQTANAAATNANDAAASANDAAERAEAIAEYSVPLMSPTTRGGAKLGSGLSMDGDVLSVALEAESDGTDAGPIVELTAKGHAEQDGTPSPDSPVEIQVARGRNLLDVSETPDELSASTVSVSKDSVTVTATQASGWSYVYWEVPISAAGDYAVSIESKSMNSPLSVELMAGSSRESITTVGTTLSTSVTASANTTSIRIWLYSRSTGSGAIGDTTTYVGLQLEKGSVATPYVPYGYVGLDVYDGSTHVATIPVPLPSRGWVGALPDGTADTLTLDGAGKVVWERATNETTQAVTDGVTGTVGVDVLSSTGQIADGATVLYPLATHVTEDMGYVEGWTNDFPEGCVLSCPELDALNVRYVVDDAAVTLARQWYERARSEYEGRIEALEAAVAEIIAG